LDYFPSGSITTRKEFVWIISTLIISIADAVIKFIVCHATYQNREVEYERNPKAISLHRSLDSLYYCCWLAPCLVAQQPDNKSLSLGGAYGLGLQIYARFSLLLFFQSGLDAY
jgi:hypothetical protein